MQLDRQLNNNAVIIVKQSYQYEGGSRISKCTNNKHDVLVHGLFFHLQHGTIRAVTYFAVATPVVWRVFAFGFMAVAARPLIGAVFSIIAMLIFC